MLNNPSGFIDRASLADKLARCFSSGFAAHRPYRQSVRRCTFDTNTSIDPRVERATNELGENVRESTERVTDKVEDLVDKEANKASRQFRRSVRGAERPAEGLDEVIERTILKDVGDALETK